MTATAIETTTNLTPATPARIKQLIKNNEGRLAKALAILIAGFEDNAVLDDDLYIIDQIPTHWNNGTGYLNHGVDDTSVAKRIQFIGLTEDDRLVHVTNTPVGNVIMFDRYSFGKDGVIVANMPDHIERMYGSLMRGQLSDMAISNTVRYNLGKVLFDMVDYCKEAK
tara:strand:+ start:967 stop:1467 length:501 start_codon:yes stop_codon:yes gene_type:complete